MKSVYSRRVALVTMLAIGLAVPNGLAFSTAAAYAALDLKSESQLKSEAALYETAIREIGSITSLKLATPETLKKANDIIERNIRNLRFCRSRLAALALNDSSFVSAVKARARDSKSADALAQELIKDPNAILKLQGAESLNSRMLRSTEADTSLLRQVAQQLKNAADQIKSGTKAHHTTAASVGFIPIRPTPVDNRIIGVVVLIAVAAIINSGLGFALAAVATTLVAVALIGKLISNLGTDEGKDKVAACMETINQRYRDCVAAAAKKPFR